MRRFIFQLSIVSILLFSCRTFSQNYSYLDSVQTGKKYKFILFDDTEIDGRVISQDSVSVSVKVEKVTVTLSKDDIFSVTRDLSPSKYKYIISASGGISILVKGYYEGYYGTFYKSGPTFQINCLFPFSDNKGMRIEFSYSRIKRDQNASGYYGNVEGGDLSHYSLKLAFVLGVLKSSQRFFGYANFGTGIHFSRTEESMETYYNYFDSSYTTFNNPPYTHTYLLLSLGGLAGYRFSRNFGAYAEIEYNLFASNGQFLFWGSGYFPLRVGMSYFIK